MMRIFNILMASALILLGTVACSNRYELEGFRTQTDRYHLSAAAGQTPVIVYAGGAWKASLSEKVSWASLDKDAGDGLGQVMFKFTENPGLSRKVGVVIEYEGQRDTVVMYQDAGLTSPDVKTAYSELTLPKCSGKVSTGFTTNLGEQASELKVRTVYPEGAETEWLSDVMIEGEAISYKVASHSEGQRSATIELYIYDADDKKYSCSVEVTQTSDDPYIAFGVGKYGLNAANVRLSVIDTNMDAYFTNMYEGAQIEFPSQETPWASVNEEDGMISLQQNETGQSRDARLKLSYVDLEGNVWPFVGDFQQSNQPKPAYSFAELKDFVQETSGSYELADIDGCIEAYVVGDAGPNMDNNPNIDETNIDYDYNYRVNYVQNADASSGLRLLMATKEDNTLKRYAKVYIDLRGLKIVKESNPVRFTLDGLTADSIMSQEEGAGVVAKSKTVDQLTDDDIYTYTTLTGLEVAFKSGSWTNCHDGYLRKIKADKAVNPDGVGVNEKGGSAPVVFDAIPLLLRDAAGKQIRMVTNNETPWRKYGQGVKQGVCSFSGIITHHNMPRWAKDGDIGKYSIRVMDEADIVQTAERFSTVVAAWMWDGTFKEKSKPSYPQDADTDVYKITNNFGATIDCYTTDFNHLDNSEATSVSNAVLYVKKDKGPLWGSDDPSDMTAAPYVQVEFSTAGMSGTNMVFNWTVGGGNQSLSYLYYPADWHIEYSVDGETYTSLGIDYAVHPIVWNSNSTNGKCPLWAVGGMHEYSTNLPSSLLGQSKVYIRIKASTNKCCGKTGPVTDRYAATISNASGGRIRFGEISVEYN